MNKLNFRKLALRVFFVSVLILSLITYRFSSIKEVDAQASVPAFAGAEGFGAVSVGGRGGKVYNVTNLNDSGAGSLRECVAAPDARTCVFKVGGTISLNSILTVSNPYLTIAGQTAPGGGITLKKGSGGSGDIITSKTHDVIVRYITGRIGPGGENHVTQLATNNSTSIYNIIFDHCSFSWGVDSIWETWYQTHNITMQWSYINEGLDCSTHSKGCHSKGIMIGGYAGGEGSNTKGSYDVSVLHNLMAHDGERTPLMQFCGTGQVINNVTYNPYWTFAHQELNCIDQNSPSNVNWIGNYHKQGPDSTSTTNLKVSVTGNNGKGGAYIANNLSRLKNKTTDSNWIVQATGFTVITPFSAPTVTTTDAVTAYNQVLDEGGNSKGLTCDGSWVGRRDSIDARVVNEVRAGTGHIIDDPSEVGGWVTIASGTACTDSDNDGMPDVWEDNHPGLNKTVADNNGDIDGNGYTNLEDYLNGAGAYSGPTFTPVPVTPTVTQTPVSPTPSRTPTPIPPSVTPTPMPLLGDITGANNIPDNKVDINDYNKMKTDFGKTGTVGFIISDINNNGKVDIFDFNYVIMNYGKTSL